MAILLQQRYPVLATIPLETLREAVQDFNSMDRAWRLILQDEESLRGKDYYKDKDLLEQNKMIELGYDIKYPINKQQGRLMV